MRSAARSGGGCDAEEDSPPIRSETPIATVAVRSTRDPAAGASRRARSAPRGSTGRRSRWYRPRSRAPPLLEPVERAIGEASGHLSSQIPRAREQSPGVDRSRAGGVAQTLDDLAVQASLVEGRASLEAAVEVVREVLERQRGHECLRFGFTSEP